MEEKLTETFKTSNVFLVFKVSLLNSFFSWSSSWPPSDSNGDGLPLSYDRESGLCEQCYLTQSNGNRRYADAQIVFRSEYAKSPGGNDKKVATGTGFQVPRREGPKHYKIFGYAYA